MRPWRGGGGPALGRETPALRARFFMMLSPDVSLYTVYNKVDRKYHISGF
ncbi:MAG: hypothetical protein ACC609_09055 [Methanobacterium formicicum]